MHLLRRALEKAAAPANEERVPRKHGALVGVGVLEEVADAVLRVAWRVQGADGDAGAEGEGRVVRRGGRDGSAVLTADDGELVVLEDFVVAACVVVVAV